MTLKHSLLIPFALLAAACTGALFATPTPTAAPNITPTPLSANLDDIKAEFAALPQGDATAGKTDFTTAGCAACHALEGDKRIVGPSLAGIAARAGERLPDYSAELYIYMSITRPNQYIVEGFTAGLMPQAFSATLDAQRLADLIAFLMTLE
jgi:mono/diheme cytochrome c family protein